MNRERETEPEWEFLNGCDERDLVDEVALYKREFNRLEALIQQTHGCHHSWVNRAVELGKEVERLRAEVGQLHVLRADLENAQRLARIQADEHEKLKAENATLKNRTLVLEAWAEEIADDVTSMRMRNILQHKPGAGT